MTECQAIINRVVPLLFMYANVISILSSFVSNILLTLETSLYALRFGDNDSTAQQRIIGIITV